MHDPRDDPHRDIDRRDDDDRRHNDSRRDRHDRRERRDRRDDDDQGIALVVYVDATCPLCRSIARWLDAQPKFVPLDCVPAQSAACALTPEALLAQLTVVASDGAIYRGTNAWLVCLWALRRWRAWSLRLARPALRPLAQRLFAMITGAASLTKAIALRPADVVR